MLPNFFTPEAIHSSTLRAVEASEKLLSEQLSLAEKAQAQLREQTDAVLQHSLAATRIGIDAMIATQKAMLSAASAAAPAADQ